jgi:hypothetical protein
MQDTNPMGRFPARSSVLGARYPAFGHEGMRGPSPPVQTEGRGPKAGHRIGYPIPRLGPGCSVSGPRS